MTSLAQRFSALGVDRAPGQERQTSRDSSDGPPKMEGIPVDFSHGDVDAFEPIPGSLDTFIAGVGIGGRRAYTQYKGDLEIREGLALRLAQFTGAPVSAADGLIVTPGTQGALFLALASTVAAGDRVAIIRPDYFANRKLVQYLDGVIEPVSLDYLGGGVGAGLNVEELEAAFKAGARVFVFSNPNNPTGAVYSGSEIDAIARLATKYGVTVIVDELYSRLLYDGTAYKHLRDAEIDPDKILTILGPSKTESLSGYRLGVAFGAPAIISRMERLQAIVSLRAAGYSQSVLQNWFAEPKGWIEERIAQHKVIRDALYTRLVAVDGVAARLTEAGSYIFPRLPKLRVEHGEFVDMLRHQAGVTVTPGTEFSPDRADSVRLNFSQDLQAAIGAIERMIELVSRYRA